MAHGFAKDTMNLRSAPPVHVSDYFGKYAIICFNNDHEKTVGGIIEDIKYNELFEQPTLVFRILYGGEGIVEIPRSNILWIKVFHLGRN